MTLEPYKIPPKPLYVNSLFELLPFSKNEILKYTGKGLIMQLLDYSTLIYLHLN